MELVETAPPPELAERARLAAAEAQVDVRLAASADEIAAISRVLAEVWGTRAESSPAPRNVLVALADTGGYVAGAWRSAELLGASFGVTYLDVDGPCLRSQVTGTLQARRGIGEALKRHQFAWAARHGMRRVTWTFDPLVRSNARFNLDRLGARIIRFVPDFYGLLDDGLNRADETDRCVVSLEVASAPASHRAGPVAQLLGAGHSALLDVDDAGSPVVRATPLSRVVVATPQDIVGLRQSDPDRAVEWRHAIRRAFSLAFDAGLVADLVTSDGWYRLQPEAFSDT